jgi:predicted metal-dependent HD superfamily phosphohydrolase
MLGEFVSISRILGLNESKSVQLYESITKAYSEPHRHYHTIKHIYKMFESIKFYVGNSTKYSLLFLSCLYHDVVYDTHSGTNEEDSFKKLEIDFSNYLLADEILECKNLILATKKHELIENYYEFQIFLDSDLLILGSDTDVYNNYSIAIRKEYHWVEEKIYKKERAKVLENFLNRDTIYYSDIFKHKHESKARENLLAEIKVLKG